MPQPFPDEQWTPLTLDEAVACFDGAPFAWCIAGGYALECFLGRTIRSHDDLDVVVFRYEQLAARAWLKEWHLYAADPPGTLRPWPVDEFLPEGIHDIWGHTTGAQGWQMQLLLAEVEGDAWYSRRDPRVRGPRADMMTEYDGIPCLRPEVQLFYKARMLRPKDEVDLQACLPSLPDTARQWLRQSIVTACAADHPWLERL